MGEPAPSRGGLARLGRIARAVAYSLVPLVVLLVLLEIVLAIAGVGDPARRLSILRGFDEGARYILPHPGKPGWSVTQMNDGRWPEVEIPPRDGRIRVILLGGSNTQGFPASYLQEQLNRAQPEPGFEVVNLGRAGYGSKRVRILLGQALELKPDIVFLYEGHNEFTELGFAAELAVQWSQPWVQRGAHLLTRLRTVNVLMSALDALRPAPEAARRPEPWARRSDASRFLAPDATRAILDQFRENLRAMCRQADAAGAGLLISTSVTNLLEPPMGIAPDPALDREQVTAYQRLEGQARELVPARFRKGWIETDPAEPTIRMRTLDWGSSIAPEALAAQRAERGAFPAPPALRALQSPLDGGPFWTDPADWRPAVDTVLATTDAFFRRELQPGEAEDLRRALELLEQARALGAGPNAAHTQAVCTWLLGEDDARAVAYFGEAANLDRAPTHATDETNDIVRAIAAEFPQAELVDADALFRSRCPEGLVGYELMMDTCHLHVDVRPKLMDDFVPAVLRLAARRPAR